MKRDLSTLAVLLAGACALASAASAQTGGGSSDSGTGGAGTGIGVSPTNPTPGPNASPTNNPFPNPVPGPGPVPPRTRTLTPSPVDSRQDAPGSPSPAVPDAPGTPGSDPNSSDTRMQGDVYRDGRWRHSGEGAPGAAGQRPRTDRRSAREVRRAIMDLGRDGAAAGASGSSRFGGVSDLKVDARGGRVAIEGTVASQEEKDRVFSAASAVVGSENIDNRLIVK